MTDVPYQHSEMTIAFDFEGGAMRPSISFSPVGRITPMTVERHLGWLYRQIQMAQTIQRNGNPNTRFEMAGSEPPGRGEEDVG
jgi:hypothetical protein